MRHYGNISPRGHRVSHCSKPNCSMSTTTLPQDKTLLRSSSAPALAPRLWFPGFVTPWFVLRIPQHDRISRLQSPFSPSLTRGFFWDIHHRSDRLTGFDCPRPHTSWSSFPLPSMGQRVRVFPALWPSIGNRWVGINFRVTFSSRGLCIGAVFLSNILILAPIAHLQVPGFLISLLVNFVIVHQSRGYNHNRRFGLYKSKFDAIEACLAS